MNRHASIIAIKHDAYPSLVAENDTLKANLKKFDKVFKSKKPTKKITLKKHATQFEAETDPSVANHDTIKSIWDDMVNTDTSVKSKVETLRERHCRLEPRIKVEEENRFLSSQNVCRQKFDYFPFLTLLITKAYKRKLLEDEDYEDEPEEELEEEPTLKKRKQNNKASIRT